MAKNATDGDDAVSFSLMQMTKELKVMLMMVDQVKRFFLGILLLMLMLLFDDHYFPRYEEEKEKEEDLAWHALLVHSNSNSNCSKLVVHVNHHCASVMNESHAILPLVQPKIQIIEFADDDNSLDRDADDVLDAANVFPINGVHKCGLYLYTDVQCANAYAIVDVHEVSMRCVRNKCDQEKKDEGTARTHSTRHSVKHNSLI